MENSWVYLVVIYVIGKINDLRVFENRLYNMVWGVFWEGM